MTQPIDLDLNLNGNYSDQAGAAADSTDRLVRSLGVLTVTSAGVSRALDAAAPSRGTMAAWAGFSAAAAQYQQQMAGINASTKVTGQSFSALSGGVRQLARDFPLGNAGAIQMTQAVQGLGLSAKGQETQIRSLARTMTQLGAATGELGPSLATSFGQLNRQLGGLDPNRVQKMADVLTTLSLKSGASASGIVGFSKAIAPMAQSAGIGQSAIMGIATSFSKLGDDGYAAANAVNKMLSDMNRSVRDGSNDMAAYAGIVGKTTDQFKAMFEANPSQAITEVTQAIAKAGPRGPHMLETLGLEGIRTQRALLEATQSGGLQASISQAVGAYGNNSTAKAAAAAFGGLNDAMVELRTTAGQVAEALGRPLLRPLTEIAHVGAAALRPVNAVAGSRVGQDILTGGAYAGIAALILRRVLGVGTLAAVGYQAATSGPVRAAIGGFQAGRYGTAALDREGRFAQAGRPMVVAAATPGQAMGRGFMDTVNRRVFDFTQSYATTRRERLQTGMEALDARHGPGYASRVLGGAATYGSLGFQGYMNLFRAPFRMAKEPATEREFNLTAPGGPGRRLLGELGESVKAMDFTRAGKAMSVFHSEVSGTSRAMARFTSSLALATRDVGGFALKGGGQLLGAAAKGVGGLAMNLLGSPTMMALTAATTGYSIYRGMQGRNAAEDQRVSGMDIHSTLNAYRESMGRAGEAAVTLADQMAAASKTISTSVTTMAAATSVTNQDITAAGKVDRSKATHLYGGSNAQIAQQISALNLQGLQPGDVQAAKIDLLRQGYSQNQVNDILGRVQTGGTKGVLTQGQISGLVGGAEATSQHYSPSLGTQMWRGLFGVRSGSHAAHAMVGHGGITAQIGKEAQQQLDLLAQAIGQQYNTQQQTGGQAYAMQNQLRSVNQAMQEAQRNAHRTGDYDLEVATARTLSRALTGKAVNVSAADIDSAGGNLVQLMAKRGRSFDGQSLAAWQKMGVTLSGAGTGAQAQVPYMQQILNNVGLAQMGSYFGTDQLGQPGAERARQAVNQAMVNPDDLQKQADAVQAMLAASTKAGTSLTDLADQARRAAEANGNVADTGYQLARALEQRAEFQASSQFAFQQPGQVLGTQIVTAAQHAQATGNTQEAQQERAGGQQSLSDLQSQVQEQFKARIMAQRNYEVQVSRSQYDFHLQTQREEDDFNRQALRQQEDYQTQRVRSEQDFYISRQRQIRDFNIQIQREVQDATKQLYSPYERIQVKPTWDIGNLMVNMREQEEAMRRQVVELAQMRKRGLSQTTIRTLGLDQADNAQELQQLTGDLGNNPGLIRQLNQMSASRQGAAGALVTNPSNTSYQRQQEDLKRAQSDAARDFARTQDRMAQDFSRTTSRQRQDFGIQMDRQRSDFNTQLGRMAQDLKNADQVIAGSFSQITSTMNKIMHGQQVSFSSLLVNGLDQDLATITKYHTLISKAMAGIYQPDGSANPGNPKGTRRRENNASGADWTVTISGNAPPPSTSYVNPVMPVHAAGGIGLKPQAGIWAEAGPEALLPLNQRGMDFMVSTLKQYIGADDARMLSSGGRAGAVTVHATYVTDQSIVFQDAKIAVASNDPDEFARKSAEATRRDNLTSARGVRWSRTR